MTTATAQQTETTTYDMSGACDRDGCTTLECPGCEAAPVRRTRRVRCAGCNELFAREQLTEGQCSRCNSIVEMIDPNTGETFLAITEPVYLSETDRGEMGIDAQPAIQDEIDEHNNELAADETADENSQEIVERRCRECCEWTVVSELQDGNCPECHAAITETATRDAEQAEAERSEEQSRALAEVERLMVESATPSVRTPGWQPATWEIWMVVGSAHQAMSGILTFDEAQREAKLIAKAEAVNYNERCEDEGVAPIKAVWRNVKTWEVGEVRIEIRKVG